MEELVSDPFRFAQGHEDLQDWDPFEDLELLELTGDLAMESDDLEGLEAWLAQAATKLPWDKVKPKEERLKHLRGFSEEPRLEKPSEESREKAQLEMEAIKSSAEQKLFRKRLVPSMDLELSEQEQAILEKEHQKENIAPQNQKVIQFQLPVIFPNGVVETLEVDPCDHGSRLLVQLMQFKRTHPFPEDFAVFLPSGRLLDFHKPLQVQGVHGASELRIDEACFAPAELEAESSDEEPVFDDFTREAENGWNLIYWPLCVALATFDEALQATQRHHEVVVLGWNASDDIEVMQLCHEVSFNIGSDYLIVTGRDAPPDGWWLTSQEEADLVASQGSRLRVGPPRPKTSLLRLDPQGAPCDLAPAILAGIRAAGCGRNLTLLVVCRAFQSRRPVSVLNWCLQQDDYAQWKVTVLPYSWDPRFVYLEDCKHRGEKVIFEAQLLTEMKPTVWMEEEGQEAELALSRLLLAHPQDVPRRDWHNGFYSKPFKERTRQARDGVAEHCEWFRWQKSVPLSAVASLSSKATNARRSVPDPDEDDEEPPPLVSHE